MKFQDLNELRRNYIKLATSRRNVKGEPKRNTHGSTPHLKRLDAWKKLSSYVDNLEKRRRQIQSLQE